MEVVVVGFREWIVVALKIQVFDGDVAEERGR